MRTYPFVTAVVAALVATGCDSAQLAITEPRGALMAKPAQVTDPTATWKLPLASAGLALQSDGLYGDGTYSVYANGVCGVETTIYATTAASNSGDATITTQRRRNCQRAFTLVYPDGGAETLPSFNNLNQLQNTSYSIPVGTEVKRRLVINPEVFSSNSRCGRLMFGENNGVQGHVGAGSDSLLVNRVDARTWHVRSQDAPNNKAWCETTGELFDMPVAFVIVASHDLP